MLHMKYLSLSSWQSVTNISWKYTQLLHAKTHNTCHLYTLKQKKKHFDFIITLESDNKFSDNKNKGPNSNQNAFGIWHTFTISAVNE